MARRQPGARKKGKSTRKGGAKGGGNTVAILDEEEHDLPAIPPAFKNFQQKLRATPSFGSHHCCEKTPFLGDGFRDGTNTPTPYLPVRQPGALIHDWILDTLVRSITGQDYVIFPGILDRWVAKNTKKEFQRYVGGRRFIAPLNVHKDHWVLVRSSC